MRDIQNCQRCHPLAPLYCIPWQPDRFAMGIDGAIKSHELDEVVNAALHAPTTRKIGKKDACRTRRKK
jgi:hypothetical protein